MLEPFELRGVQSDDDDLEDEIYCAGRYYEFDEVSDVEHFMINFRCTFFPFVFLFFPTDRKYQLSSATGNKISIFLSTIYRIGI